MPTQAPVGRTILASAARTASVTTDDQPNLGHSGVHVIINVTAFAATPSVVPTIQGKDPASGRYYDILVGAAITDVTIGTPPAAVVLKVGPGITAVPNQAAADFLPAIWRVSMTAADSDSVTYSIGANLVS